MNVDTGQFTALRGQVAELEQTVSGLTDLLGYVMGLVARFHGADERRRPGRRLMPSEGEGFFGGRPRKPGRKPGHLRAVDGGTR
jgi:hypothetical protein